MTDHVKIYGVKPRIQYTADGTLTEYEFPFAIFKTSDIDVYFGNTKQESTSYTVSEARHSDGGTVTFTSAPTSGTIVTIVRNLSIERTSDFQEGSTLRANVLNDELDYQIACQQQIAENLNRSMSLPPYADSDIDLTLPTPCAGKAVVWNSAGTALENSTVSVNALESTLNGYKTVAESAASTATTKAGIASDKADIATTQAQTATTQAGIASAKAKEAASSVNQLNGMRTNCITDIPQDIKLTLLSNTLTLKAGSKLHVPNGFEQDGTTKKFDVYTCPSDLIIQSPDSSSTSQRVVLIDISNYNWNFRYTLDNCFSGATQPTPTEANAVWYDTTNNVIKRTTDSGNTWVTNETSFPICIFSRVQNVGVTSIDQIFNGFGYIGNTLFVLPGVKALHSNGFNPDGTLNNDNVSVQNVLTFTGGNGGQYAQLILNKDGSNCQFADYKTTWKYFADKNTFMYLNNGDTNWIDCGTYSQHNNQVTYFNTKPVFHATDYNDVIKYTDRQMIISWGMPNYAANINVTFPDSAHQYTAPSDGILIMNFYWNDNTVVTGYINGFASPYKYTNQLNGNQNMQYIVPLASGDKFYWNNSMSGATVNSCSFVPYKGV